MSKVLITGGSGLLATNWAIFARDEYDITLLLHRRKISLSGVHTSVASLNSLEDCLSVLKQYQPDVVIHAAGLTSVEECESNFDLAKRVNVELAEDISKACHHRKVKLVHISTDHLFSGDGSYALEEDGPNPINNYAKTKLQGERGVLKNCSDALVIRTNFFGWGAEYRHSFTDFILDKLRNDQTVDLFLDVFITPILASELSKQVHQLINIGASGIFNVVGGERVSKYEFGVKLAKQFSLDTGLINAVTFDEKSNLVARPKDMSLSNTKLTQAIGRSVPNLDEQFAILRRQECGVVGQVKLETIPYGRHYIDDDDISSVVEVLKHGMLTQGPKVAEFEQKVASYVGAKYAVAVSSATAALHLACVALGLGKGDKVVTSPNTFVATSNSILYVGAQPVFIDIELRTLNIDIDQVEKAILNSDNIKAIFPVHFAGFPCDMERIRELADKYNLAVVEDAAHALGSIYDNGDKVGNCQYSDMTIFSFHPVKGIAAGEGGMVTTNNVEFYRKLILLRSHGISKGNFEFPGISKPDNSLRNRQEALEDGELRRWYYEMQYLGYNYRITDIQCALGISQMNKIDKFLNARKSMVEFYDKAFKNMPHISPLQIQGRGNSSHHIYVVSIDFDGIGISRNKFMKKLANLGVGSQVHYIPVVFHPYYKDLGYDLEDFPNTRKHYLRALSIPLYYGMSFEQQDMVVSSIADSMQ